MIFTRAVKNESKSNPCNCDEGIYALIAFKLKKQCEIFCLKSEAIGVTIRWRTPATDYLG